jgi:hypothetical protein
VQYAYPKREGNSDAKTWISEGTAEAAELSSAVMVRNGGLGWHSIFDNLTSNRDFDAYQTEDFWVYYGLRRGLPLGYLHPFFEEGFTISDVDVSMGNEVEAEYQAYVRNNVFTKEETYGGQLPLTCSFNNLLEVTGGVPLEHFVFHNPNTTCLTTVENVTIPALTGTYFSVTFVNTTNDASIFLDYIVGGSDVAYHVYREGEPMCANIAEGERSFVGSSSEDYYVVVANGSKFSSAEVTLVVAGCNEE